MSMRIMYIYHGYDNNTKRSVICHQSHNAGPKNNKSLCQEKMIHSVISIRYFTRINVIIYQYQFIFRYKLNVFWISIKWLLLTNNNQSLY